MNNDGGVDVSGKDKRFVFVLVILLFLAVCLAVGIVLIKINGGDTGNSVGLDEESLEIKSEVFEKCKNSIDGSDEMEQTELLTECSGLIMANDYEKKYSKEVLDVLIEVDNVSQDINSAVNVINAAYFYDDQDLVQKYTDILKDRSPDDGDDQEEGGVG